MGIDKSEWVVERVLRARARRTPNRPFLFVPGEPPLTFAQADEGADRVAAGLAAAGVAAGDRAIVMLPNGSAFALAWFGISRRGAVMVPVNPAFRGAPLEHVVTDSGAVVVFTTAAGMRQLVEILPRLAIVLTVVVVGEVPPPIPGLQVISFDDLSRSPAAPADAVATYRDIGMIIYTSGTTGAPKGVLLPNAHAHLNAHVYLDHLGIDDTDVFYCCLPLFHANGLQLQLYGALIAGAPLHLATQFSASGWIDEVRACGATVTNLLGVMSEFVFRQPPRPVDGDNALRRVLMAPIPQSFGKAFAARFGVSLVEVYGTTEMNCPLYTPLAEEVPQGACGRLKEAWFDARIVDPETDEEVGDGTVGELVVRPREPWCFMAGYHGRPGATARAVRNLWFHSGDAMRRDARGFYYFVDRMGDRIRRRGENVSSFEIETVLLERDEILEVAVVGVRSGFDDKEDEIKACIAARPGQILDLPALVAHCARRLPAFAVPRFFDVLATLPKTETQKVTKAALRAAGVGETTWDRLALDPPASTPRTALEG